MNPSEFRERLHKGVDGHRPYVDDGLTYCGLDKHEGCGHLWPCPTVRGEVLESDVELVARAFNDVDPLPGAHWKDWRPEAVAALAALRAAGRLIPPPEVGP